MRLKRSIGSNAGSIRKASPKLVLALGLAITLIAIVFSLNLMYYLSPHNIQKIDLSPLSHMEIYKVLNSIHSNNYSKVYYYINISVPAETTVILNFLDSYNNSIGFVEMFCGEKLEREATIYLNGTLKWIYIDLCEPRPDRVYGELVVRLYSIDYEYLTLLIILQLILSFIGMSLVYTGVRKILTSS